MIKKLACFGVAGMALAAACSGTSDDGLDDSGTDATSDQSALDANKEASINDASTDVALDAAPDSPPDAAHDSTVDAIADAIADAIVDAIVDAPKETSTADAGNCSSNSDCLLTEYCNKGFANCSGKGSCTVIPSFCSNLCSYMCGCDKATYCNSCFAAKQRTTIAYSGACE